MSALTLISVDEVKKHSYSGDCWVVVHGQVYDLSAFDHPGGSDGEPGFLRSNYYVRTY